MATPQRAVTSSDIAKAVLTARTTGEVEALIAALRPTGLAHTRPIGDRNNNAGTVEISSSPYYSLAERVTNSIDAVLDLAAAKRGYRALDDWPVPVKTPREAARILFKVPKAGLTDLTESERRDLAKQIAVVLEESGVRDRPTVIVEDWGCGAGTQMAEGILSLNRSNKLSKPWLHGAYGQGGSTTLRFCPFTIFVSRKAPELLADGEPDLVGWTIAFRDEGDPYRDALPVYKYYVDSEGRIPVFDPANLPEADWHGTRIVHVEYDLHKYSAAYTQLTNGAWGMFQGLLFDPVLPFLIGGRRQVDLDAVKKGVTADDDMSDLVVAAKDSTRVILGNKTRLEVGPKGSDPEIAWRGSEVVDLTKAHGRDLGRLRVNYWVVRRPAGSSSTSDPTLGYVTPENAVTVTLSGQRHESRRRAWLREKLGLPYLSKSLIVQVDLDDLSPPARRELFSATRERAVEGQMTSLVYSETVAALKRDGELRRLENEMRERAMSKGTEAVADKVRAKLAKFVSTFLKGQTQAGPASGVGNEGAAPTPKPPGPPSPPRSTDDKHLPNAPTDLRFERDPIIITQGRRTTVWVHIDAKNGYLPRHEDDLTMTFTSELEGKVVDITRSELLAGKSQWSFFAQADAPLVEGEVEASLLTVNGVLRASAKVRVIPAPKPTPSKKTEKPQPLKGPEIVWVRREDWDDEFTEKTVGQVNIGDEHTDIRVNRHHPLIDKALKDKSLTEGARENRENRYLFAVACGLFRQAYAHGKGNGPSDEEVQAEQERLSEAVLIAIDDQMVELDD